MALAMAQNTLKQKAREFAKTYDVPYLTALKAVDEPLHELREVVRSASRRHMTANFRLTTERSAFEGIPCDVRDEHWLRRAQERGSTLRVEDAPLDYKRFIVEKGWDDFGGWNAADRNLVIELGRRATLLDSVGVQDIWAYRELYRAGILGADAEALEPRRCYFTGSLDVNEWLDKLGLQLGICAVAVKPFMELDINNGWKLIPVTESQLDRLFLGEPVDVNSIRWPLSAEEPGEKQRRIVATAKSLLPDYAGRGTQLQVFFTEENWTDANRAMEVIEEFGLESSEFKLNVFPAKNVSYDVGTSSALKIVDEHGDSVASWVPGAFMTFV